jgi:hypothetical protein
MRSACALSYHKTTPQNAKSALCGDPGKLTLNAGPIE